MKEPDSQPQFSRLPLCPSTVTDKLDEGLEESTAMRSSTMFLNPCEKLKPKCWGLPGKAWDRRSVCTGAFLTDMSTPQYSAVRYVLIPYRDREIRTIQKNLMVLCVGKALHRHVFSP